MDNEADVGNVVIDAVFQLAVQVPNIIIFDYTYSSVVNPNDIEGTNYYIFTVRFDRCRAR